MCEDGNKPDMDQIEDTDIVLNNSGDDFEFPIPFKETAKTVKEDYTEKLLQQIENGEFPG